MKLVAGLLGFLVVVGIGGMIYLNVADIHIAQTTVTKQLSMPKE